MRTVLNSDDLRPLWLCVWQGTVPTVSVILAVNYLIALTGV